MKRRQTNDVFFGCRRRLCAVWMVIGHVGISTILQDIFGQKHVRIAAMIRRLDGVAHHDVVVVRNTTATP